MIVLDEELQDPYIVSEITAWYPGKVISVRALRPRTIIKDEAIVTLLQALANPTFVTINVEDFWWVMRADANLCLVCIDLPNARALQVPTWLRKFLRLDMFKTKAGRMGIVALLRAKHIEFYRADHKIKTIEWTP